MNAVIYARYSSVGQRDVSIEDQIREIKQYAEIHNYNIIKTYADRAMTGRNDNRPQFRRMIADAEKHAFQIVLVYKHDRFSRNQYDSVIYKKRLSDHGVRLVAVTEPIPDGHGAMLLESIYTAMAEEYSANLSQNVKRGQHGNALKCMANHMPTFGYHTNPQTRKFEIDPVTAPLVQIIFNMTLDGKTQNEILEYLRSKGYKRSKNWLYHLLKNERYTGVYIHGDVRIDGGMPQIISKEDFDKVRDTMKARQHKPQAKPQKYLLSGRIYCGYCHKLMSGEYGISHTGTEYRYYTCTTSKRHKNCTKKRIRADYLENKVCEELRNVLTQETALQQIAKDLTNYLNETKNISVGALQSQLADVEKRMRNIQSNIERVSNVPEILINRLAELDETKKELLNRISAEQLKFDSVTPDEIITLIHNFDMEDDKLIINAFVTQLTVYDDHAVLEYDISGDNTKRIGFDHDDVWRSSMSWYPNLTISFPLSA